MNYEKNVNSKTGNPSVLSLRGFCIGSIVALMSMAACSMPGAYDSRAVSTKELKDLGLSSASAFVFQAGHQPAHGARGINGEDFGLILPKGVELDTSGKGLFVIKDWPGLAAARGVQEKYSAKELEELNAKFIGKPFSELNKDPTFTALYGVVDLPVPKANEALTTAMNDVMESFATLHYDQAVAKLKKYGLYETYLEVKSTYNEPLPESEKARSARSTSANYGSNHFYLNLLPLDPNNLLTGEIFLVSGPDHDNGMFGQWGHGNFVDRSRLDQSKSPQSNCLWSANGEIDGIDSWQYATIDPATGKFRQGVYAEKLGKNQSEFAYVRLRPKTNLSSGPSVAARAASHENQPFSFTTTRDDNAWYCTELVWDSWKPWARVENNYNWNALDYVWPQDVYEAATLPIADWEWVFNPFPNYVRVIKSVATLSIAGSKTRPNDADTVFWTAP
ncbi:MAG: hypothetical protein ACOYM2_08615 [Rectinemataceae bacterium]